jgi:pimeloyl-ACP methyl ester carboxylesterase
VRGTEEVSAGDFSATSLRCFKASRRAVGRVTLAQRDPRGFAVFKQALAEHSALGAANTQLGCQKERPSLYHLENEMAGLTVPTLILTGDEDWPCLTPALLMKRNAELRAHH